MAETPTETTETSPPIAPELAALLPPLIAAAVAAGIEVAVERDGFRVGGFYKSGSVLLRPLAEGGFHAVDRYGDAILINELRDLVGLNYSWWTSSRGRHDGWEQPDACWAGLLERFGFVRSRVVTTTEYEDLGG